MPFPLETIDFERLGNRLQFYIQKPLFRSYVVKHSNKQAKVA
jgi:hypothetical protein